jgi:hypothetical protein
MDTMVTLADRVARAVNQHAPAHRCTPCLSLQLRVTEKEVREAAQVLAARGDFKVLRRPCVLCAVVDDVLVSGKAAFGGEQSR